MSLSRVELESFAIGLAAQSQRWRPFVRHDPFERVYEQLWDDGEVNAWLICWSIDQDTGFHDHDDAAAAITVIEGEVYDERLRFGGDTVSRRLNVGSTLYVPPVAIHRVRHEGVSTAITLHAYSPPLRRAGAYQVGSEGQLERISQPVEQELRRERVRSPRLAERPATVVAG